LLNVEKGQVTDIQHRHVYPMEQVELKH